jgi:excisionase family DNA binding protein
VKRPARQRPAIDLPRLMTPAEVAAALNVDTKTAKRWAYSGRIRSCKTPGGQMRFFAEDVEALVRVADR